MKTQLLRVDVTMSKKEQRAKDWLGEQVQDTVENGLAVRSDNVATFRKTPCNRVEEPEEDGEDSTHQVDPTNIRSKCSCVFSGNKDEHIHDIEESQVAKDIVAPLLRVSLVSNAFVRTFTHLVA